MKLATIKKLNLLNQDFYQKNAQSFSNTRQSAWHGWRKLFPTLKTLNIQRSRLSILDIGCGNGRFLSFLKKNLSSEVEYLGIDSDKELLQQAKVTYPNHNFENIDIVEALVEDKLSNHIKNKYDLIVAMGVLHHIPSQELRKTFFEQVRSLLKPKGILIVSIWKFLENEKFKQKLIPVGKTPNIQKSELEEGDCFLGWQKTNSIRYAHYVGEREEKELLENWQVITSFFADGKSGKLNKYLVLQP